VFTTKPVLDGTHPILLVSHDENDDWQFLCGTTADPKDGKLVSLGSIAALTLLAKRRGIQHAQDHRLCSGVAVER
jgi:hypothetical protein